MYNIFKSTCDFIFALLGTIVLLPLFLFVGILIAIDSRGPIIFKQERVGKGKKIFKMYKFRTMKTVDVPFDPRHPVIKDNNANLTRVGKWIRRFKIDELLQLFNVLRGDMSLIGPRPLKVEYLDMYEPWELQKFSVKPGMSGLAQVRGNGHLSAKERSYYDVEYTKIQSLRIDAEILFKTVVVVFRGEEKYIRHVSEKNMRRMVVHYMREEDQELPYNKRGLKSKRKRKNAVYTDNMKGPNATYAK